MNELPPLIQLFEPPSEQTVEPGLPGDYVGVYCVGSHITIITKKPSGFVFPKVELWSPVLKCAVPEEIQAVREGFFAMWFKGVPSELGRFGNCTREVRVTAITEFKQGRELRSDEYVR